MANKYIRLSAAATLLLGLFAYLGSLNFHLPFMTADELRYILGSPQETADYALVSGRYSSLLMIPFAEMLSFIDPTNINLIPRFFSMLLLVAGIIYLVRELGLSNLAAAFLAVFVIMAHEIDWQHNGLVSFFGIYNSLLAIFMLSLVFEERSKQNIWIYILVMALLVGAYASELFIGLSLCYMILKVAISRKAKILLHSPFFWSMMVYVAAFLAIKATTSLAHWNAQEMSTYLVGAVSMYSADQMLTAALLYFINSLPYYHYLGISVSVSVGISSLVLASISGYLFVLWHGIKKRGISNEKIKILEREWLLAVVMFLLAIVPNFLLALQPMKVDWVLRNASVHYVFSYYTWIGLAIVCAYFAKQNISFVGNKTVVRGGAFIALLGFCGVALMAANKNINFVNEYRASRGKWIELNEILKQNISKEVVVPPTYLQHPYISSVTPDQLKKFAKKYYDAQLRICSINSEINLNEEVNEKIVRLDGFSVIEFDGRWTEGGIAEIRLVEENPKINFIEFEVTSVFYENKNTSVIVVKGAKKFVFKIDGVGKYRFDISDNIDGQIKIQFQIANPISPSTLGLSTDTRSLGVMVKNVRLGFMDLNNQENLHVIEMCY